MKAIVYKKETHEVQYVISNCVLKREDHIEGDEISICGLNLNIYDYVVVDNGSTEINVGDVIDVDSVVDKKVEALKTDEQKRIEELEAENMMNMLALVELHKLILSLGGGSND